MRKASKENPALEQERRELIHCIQSNPGSSCGQQAAVKLIASNYGLVKTRVNKYHFTEDQRKEAIAIGLEALFDAALKFDLNRGVRFSTFAQGYIRGRLIRLFQEWNDLKRGYGLPRYIANLVHRVKSENIDLDQYEHLLAKQLNTKPSVALLVKQSLARGTNTTLRGTSIHGKDREYTLTIEDCKGMLPEDIDKIVLTTNFWRELEDGLASLSKSQAMIFLLVSVDQLPIGSVSELTGLPHRTIHRHHRQACESLAKFLTTRGLSGSYFS